MHGLPCTIKDAVETAGIRSTNGAGELSDHVPQEDATAVARLKRAGAVVFGKTNVPAWSGDMQTYNDLFGTTSNPWALDRTPGGSSGGSAAAVAAGVTGVELGTDIGGSIRIPAHLCGVFGLRPSAGVVPQHGYLAGPRSSISGLDNNVFGPLARGVEDLELVLDVLAGPDGPSATGWSLSLPAPPYAELSGYRIGLWLDDAYCPVDRECLHALEQVVGRLADRGAQVYDARPAVGFEESFTTYWRLLMASNGLNFEEPDEDPLSHARWLHLDHRRMQQRHVWQSWFASGFDALICPVMATGAYPHDHSGDFRARFVSVNGDWRSHDDVARWTGLIGALGLPVATVPVAATDSGLPLGVQVVTPHLQDRAALHLARLITEEVGGYTPPPGLGV